MKTPNAVEVPEPIAELLREYLAPAETEADEQRRFDKLNGLRDLLHAIAPNASMPVDIVRWVDLDMVSPNDYNPNHVARAEMLLLLRSIMHDGFTQPVVTIWNAERQRYEIVDGFHRYWTMRSNEDLRTRCKGRLPVVVIEKDMNDRMASTVRHNRARGKHSVTGMASMVFSMLDNGMADAAICNELGMEAEELVRLKHITGFSKLFKDTEYNRAWETKNQIRLKLSQGKKVPVSDLKMVGLEGSYRWDAADDA